RSRPTCPRRSCVAAHRVQVTAPSKLAPRGQYALLLTQPDQKLQTALDRFALRPGARKLHGACHKGVVDYNVGSHYARSPMCMITSVRTHHKTISRGQDSAASLFTARVLRLSPAAARQSKPASVGTCSRRPPAPLHGVRACRVPTSR